MLAIAYYILKVTICSGILYGYYRLALHNKIFHRWNRFYLLSAVIISLSFPLIKISVWHNPAEDEGQIIKLLNVVSTGDEYIYEVSSNGSFHLSGEQVAMAVYILVSVVLTVMLLHALIKLNQLARHNPLQKIQRINVVQTEAKGTPFSFFRYIFWNSNIDMHSDSGKKIFTHEMVHVTEKHSADRLFMNMVLIFFWCNPFFWLMRREMNMIHEFIADSKAIEDNDTAAFAAMVLHAAYPQQAFGLTSSFFSSSIKRRLRMLAQMQNPRISYIGRILALPLLAFIFVAFSIKTKQLLPGDKATTSITLEKPVTVVIDAGHGGEDNGVHVANRPLEKDITLALARKIKALNTNANINIILTRDGDITQPVRSKVDFTVKQQPNAFISIHINAEDAGESAAGSGFEIYLSKHQSIHTKQAQLLGSLLATEIETTYGVSPQLKQRTGKGIWVLDAPAINYPALLIECGYLTDPKDVAFITNEKNQEKIARDILNAIGKFAKAKEDMPAAISNDMQNAGMASVRDENSMIQSGEVLKTMDTLPRKIKSVDITADDHLIIIYTDDKAEKITKTEAKKRGIALPPAKSKIGLRGVGDSVLFFLNGVEIARSDMEKIDPHDIESINVIKDESAVNKYGKRAEHGVVEITTKKTVVVGKQAAAADNDKVFQKVETEAKFPGGDAAWRKYISASIGKVIDSLQEEQKSGTCVVQFIVDTEGNLSELQPLTMQGTLLSRTVVAALKDGPKWIPAMQNGHKVKAYRRQPVTFQIENQ